MKPIKQCQFETTPQLLASDTTPRGLLVCGLSFISFDNPKQIQIAIEDLIQKCQRKGLPVDVIYINPEDLTAYNTQAYLTNSFHVVASDKQP